MKYIGIDYHTRYAVTTIMDQSGKIISKDRVENTREDIRNYFSKFGKGTKAVVEATNNWACLVEWLHDIPIDIKLANPGKTKAIASAKIKTDSIDSKVLADLLRTDFIAESYLAPKSVRDIRELVRYRMTLARLRSQLKVRVRSILFKVGGMVKATNILGEKARGELLNIPMRNIYKEEIESLTNLAEKITGQIEIFEEKIKEEAKIDSDTKILMSIPGISFFSALLIMSEIGDYNRFPTAKKLCCFAGLVPSIHASGGKIREGKIIKQGSKNLRFALLQSIPHLIKKHHGLAARYYRIVTKKGIKTARIAISRRLLTIILSMLKNRKEFNPNYKLDNNIKFQLPASEFASVSI